MNHEFYDEVLREADMFITEMEMEIENQRLADAGCEKNLMMLEKVLGLN